LANQSLSREILYGTFDSVSALIQGGADVNERDNWGFTPLIQATIMNNFRVAERLLKSGAKINQRDITGQTALQWAVNRSYQDLCALYLNHNADPNHYSADGQPIMVNPILRGEHTLIQLLVANGANLEFPQNYINAKLIGHRYELIGKADIINTHGKFIELDFEGFYLEFTVGIILRTLVTFFHSEEGKLYSAYNVVIQKIIRTLKDSVELIKYKYTPNEVKKNDTHIRKLLDKDLVAIPVAYEGHAITFIKHKQFFAKCDRGVKHIVDTVVAQKIGNPYAMNVDFLIDLTYKNKSSEYINTEIKKILHLSPFTTLPARYQLSGNCSWANVEASIPAMMLLLMAQENMGRGELAALKKSIMDYYDAWVEWDKDRVLDECITDFYQEDHAHKASIATIIAAILLQRCRVEYPREVARAKKILSILTIPEYNFILKGYINIYCTKAAGKMGEDFTKMLRTVGLNFSTLTLRK
jgi:hypothetical protein